MTSSCFVGLKQRSEPGQGPLRESGQARPTVQAGVKAADQVGWGSPGTFSVVLGD
jgi:hypothetical protein